MAFDLDFGNSRETEGTARHDCGNRRTSYNPLGRRLLLEEVTFGGATYTTEEFNETQIF